MTALSERMKEEVWTAMTDKVALITRGDCKDYADYRARCAELVGMHNATQMCLDVEAEYNREEWTDE